MENIKKCDNLDPDYEALPENADKHIKVKEEIDLKNKYDRVVNLIKQEFKKEISNKHEEVHLIQQRLLKAQKTLHLLKYVIIKSFYERKELKALTIDESVLKHSGTSKDNNTITNAQQRIHPAVKKLLGKKPLNYEIHRTRPKAQNKITVKEETKDKVVDEKNISTKTLNLDTNIKEENKQLSIDEFITYNPNAPSTSYFPIRNRQKSKHEIIIGNISKWMPKSNTQDSATHKWMVYVRGPRNNPDISHIVKKVRFFLHPSYQPNDIVELEESPFHLSRRGWGEFPLRVQLHFQCSANKPVDVIHNLKLDRTYTGRQTLGNETIVKIWLYDNNIKEEPDECDEAVNPSKIIKQEIVDDSNSEKEFEQSDVEDTKSFQPSESDSVSNSNITPNPETDDSISFGNNLINNDSHTATDIIEESVQDDAHLTDNYIEPEKRKRLKATKHILIKDGKKYLLSHQKPTTQVSLLKAKFFANTNFLDAITDTNKDLEQENKLLLKNDYLVSLVDHCYTAEQAQLFNKINNADDCEDEEDISIEQNDFIINKEKYEINIPLEYFNSTSQIVYYLFKLLPLVTNLATNINYKCCYPFVASSLEEFTSWNHAKRFCSEWYRAKHIKNLLIKSDVSDEADWTVKIILMYGRAHAFTPLANYELFKIKNESGKTVPNRLTDTPITSTLSEYVSISKLMESGRSYQRDNDVDCEIDVETLNEEVNVNAHDVEMEVDQPKVDIAEELVHPCTYIRKCAEKINIFLKPEEIVPGVWNNSSELVLLQAVKCFAEELIRKSWANNVIRNKGRNLSSSIDVNEVYAVLLQRPEFDIFLNDGLGKSVSP